MPQPSFYSNSWFTTLIVSNCHVYLAWDPNGVEMQLGMGTQGQLASEGIAVSEELAIRRKSAKGAF